MVLAWLPLLLLALPAWADSPEFFLEPRHPSANSQVLLLGGNNTFHSNFTVLFNSHQTCCFPSTVLPCGCFPRPSPEGGYRILAGDGSEVLRGISVLPHDVNISTPSRHEMLHELNVAVTPRLCRPERLTAVLLFRSFDVLPPSPHADVPIESEWQIVTKVDLSLHQKRVNVVFDCAHLLRSGFYSIEILSASNQTVKNSSWIRVEPSSSSSFLTLPPTGSIFPACSSTFHLRWRLPGAGGCRASLSFRLRVLARPPPESDGVHRGDLYIEEIPLTSNQSSLDLSCSAFDIIHEQYCFELVSVDEARSNAFQLWNTLCMHTEPDTFSGLEWSEWSSWSTCSATCDEGLERRSRSCQPRRVGRDASRSLEALAILRRHAAEECAGDMVETRGCRAMAECPDSKVIGDVGDVGGGNCTCGCELPATAGRLAVPLVPHSTCIAMMPHSGLRATSRAIPLVWRLPALSKQSHVDVIIERLRRERSGLKEGLPPPSSKKVERHRTPRLLVFSGQPFGNLLWRSDDSTFSAPAFRLGERRRSRRKWTETFTIDADIDLFFIYQGATTANGSSADVEDHQFLIVYEVRDAPFAHSVVASALGPSQCTLLLCPEAGIAAGLFFLAATLILVPPLACTAITRRMKARAAAVSERRSDGDGNGATENDDMIRSGQTECTHVSTHGTVAVGRAGNGGKRSSKQLSHCQLPPSMAHFTHGCRIVTQRSIGIQLSVQSTPRALRSSAGGFASGGGGADGSPLTTVRGGGGSSSMSVELEFDDYDGSLMPGSLLGGMPLLPTVHVRPVIHTDSNSSRSSSIDIEGIIASVQTVVADSAKATASTQSGRGGEPADSAKEKAAAASTLNALPL